MSVRNWIRGLAVAFFLSALFLPALLQKAHAAIGLEYFLAEGLDGEVILSWLTGTELENAGFFVQRSPSEDSGYIRISPFIPGEGSSISGAYYIYHDTTVTNGTTYWYRLESIDTNDQSTFHEPVAATPQPETTPTLTLTTTRTSTPTSQAESHTATPTATVAPTRTRTPTLLPTLTWTSASGYPAPATSTRQPSSTISSGLSTLTPTLTPTGLATLVEPAGVFSATATLLPLPELTLQFPPEAVAMSAARAGDQAQFSEPAAENSDAIGRWLMIGAVLVIWVALGGWFFYSMRKIQ